MARKPVDGRRAGACRRTLLPVVLGVFASSVAHAGLGERAESIQQDHVALHGTTLAVTPAVDYDVHETTTADGAHVRQYASRSGTVFAVTWSGRTQPDLRVLLAKHYDAYVAAASAHRGSHHVLSVSTPELVITVVRHARSASGAAHLPALLPAGISAGDLR